jgi:aspartyl-tRNA(Asn)/glutamyl-tRNA(Gln) amidotransferase subunit A
MTSDTPTEMQGEDLALKSAGELGQLFRTRSASPSEVLASVMARAGRLEPHINAFAETMYEDAVCQAQVADELFLRRPDDARPLEGIPLAVKEKHAIGCGE